MSDRFYREKAVGGSDVCHTCEAHVVAILDLEKERDALAAELSDAKTLNDAIGYAEAQNNARMLAAEARIRSLEAELSDQVRVTEEHQRLRYQCETENTRLAAELAGYKESHDKYCPSAERVRALEAALRDISKDNFLYKSTQIAIKALGLPALETKGE